MTLFLSHTTAAECWRSGRFDPLITGTFGSVRHQPAGSLQVERASTMLALDRLAIAYREALAFGEATPQRIAACKPTSRDVQELREGMLAFASDPVHLLLPRKSLARRISRASCHIWTTPLPGGSFARADGNVLICSPELCFVLMASCIPFHALVKLGFELCALYSVEPDGSARYDRVLPLTTPRALAAYLEQLGSIPGIAAARKALRYVVVASGSPMETALVIVLCFPPRLGGYGLPLPYMNYRIDAPRDNRPEGGKAYYLCDLCWPDKGVSVEYDSDQEHTGSDRIAEDARKRNYLASLGITTITATREQVMSPVQLDRLAHQLGRMLGVRIRDERGWDLRERGRLFRELALSDCLDPCRRADAGFATERGVVGQNRVGSSSLS